MRSLEEWGPYIIGGRCIYRWFGVFGIGVGLGLG
jgi:hypothetical protein